MRTPWVPPPALPLVGVVVRPTSLGRDGLAKRSVSPQAFPPVRFRLGGFLPCRCLGLELGVCENTIWAIGCQTIGAISSVGSFLSGVLAAAGGLKASSLAVASGRGLP